MSRRRTSSEDGRRGRLLVVSAPSGTGKTTLVERLVARVPDLVRSRSYTSRPARPGEADGVDYNFVGRPRFRQMIDANAFLEWADVFGHLYGTAAADTERERAAGRDVVLVIDVQGARMLGRHGVSATRIFVLPPSRAALEARLRGRSAGNDDEAVLRRRLETARREVAAGADYDYVVVNDNVDDCVDRLRSIVLAERARSAAMRATASEIAATFGA